MQHVHYALLKRTDAPSRSDESLMLSTAGQKFVAPSVKYSWATHSLRTSHFFPCVLRACAPGVQPCRISFRGLAV